MTTLYGMSTKQLDAVDEAMAREVENLRLHRAHLAAASVEDRPAIAMQVRRSERIVAALQAEAGQPLKSVS